MEMAIEKENIKADKTKSMFGIQKFTFHVSSNKEILYSWIKKFLEKVFFMETLTMNTRHDMS